MGLQLGLAFGHQASRPGVHQQPGGLVRGQGLQPAQVRGLERQLQAIEQVITLAEGLGPLPIGALGRQGMAPMEPHRQASGLVSRDRGRDRGLVSRRRQATATQTHSKALALLLPFERIEGPLAHVLARPVRPLQPLELGQHRFAAADPALAGAGQLGGQRSRSAPG